MKVQVVPQVGWQTDRRTTAQILKWTVISPPQSCVNKNGLNWNWCEKVYLKIWWVQWTYRLFHIIKNTSKSPHADVHQNLYDNIIGLYIRQWNWLNCYYTSIHHISQVTIQGITHHFFIKNLLGVLLLAHRPFYHYPLWDSLTICIEHTKHKSADWQTCTINK